MIIDNVTNELIENSGVNNCFKIKIFVRNSILPILTKMKISYVLLLSFLLLMKTSCTQDNKNEMTSTMDIGVARIDITPESPIRLTGFAARTKTESDKVLNNLSAKALAFGSDAQHPSILITVDLIGIQWRVTSELVDRLSKNLGIEPAQIVICASHTHGSPEIGSLINI